MIRDELDRQQRRWRVGVVVTTVAAALACGAASVASAQFSPTMGVPGSGSVVGGSPKHAQRQVPLIPDDGNTTLHILYQTDLSPSTHRVTPRLGPGDSAIQHGTPALTAGVAPYAAGMGPGFMGHKWNAAISPLPYSATCWISAYVYSSRDTTHTLTQILDSETSDGTHGLNLSFNGQKGFIQAFVSGGASNTTPTTGDAQNDGTLQVIIGGRNGSTLMVKANGPQSGQATLGAWTAGTEDMYVSAFGDGTLGNSQILYELWESSTCPTEALLRDIRRQVLQTPRRFILSGDSIIWGYNPAGGGTQNNPNIPTALQSLLGSGYTVVNAGNNGYLTSQILADWHGRRYSSWDKCLIAGATNDVLSGGALTDAQIEANKEQEAAEMVADGCDTYIATIPPLGSVAGVTGAELTQLANVNTLTRAYAANPSNHVTLVDFYADWDDPGNPGSMNPIYVASDNEHPSSAGDVYEAGKIYGRLHLP